MVAQIQVINKPIDVLARPFSKFEFGILFT